MSARSQLPSLSLLQPLSVCIMLKVTARIYIACWWSLVLLAPSRVCSAFTSKLPSTCSNPLQRDGWSWQVLTWMPAATYTTSLNGIRSKEKNCVSSSSSLGELALSAICSQGLHSLLHTEAFHATSIHVCKSSKPMLSGTWHSVRLWD